MSSFWPFLLGIVIIVIGLAVSIGLHELGHLVPAKLFGVKVSQYMIGFGPRLFSRTRGETEYGVKAIPLGGYIAMAGMYPPATKKRRGRGFFGRIVQDAREVSAESAEGVPPERLFYNLPVWKRIIIMLGGPFMNLVLGFVLFAILLSTIGQVSPTTTLAQVETCITTESSCSATDPVAPGAAAGLQAGDVITAIDGVPTPTWNDLTSAIRASEGNAFDVTVDRNGTSQTLTVSPVMKERIVYDDSGTPVTDSSGRAITENQPYVGIAPTTDFVRQPITAAFDATGKTISGTFEMIIALPQRVYEVGQAAFGGADRALDGPISVVGVGRVAGEITSSNQVTPDSKVASLLGILASLNIALFAFNLIPLLPLDGGHVAGALWEYVRRGWAAVRKKPRPGPLDIARFMPVTFLVVALLIAVSALLIYADIVKPVTIF